MGIDFITLKEAAHRYGLSTWWFRLRNRQHKEPHAFRINGRGRIYYDMLKTDAWFKANMVEVE